MRESEGLYRRLERQIMATYRFQGVMARGEAERVVRQAWCLAARPGTPKAKTKPECPLASIGYFRWNKRPFRFRIEDYWHRRGLVIWRQRRGSGNFLTSSPRLLDGLGREPRKMPRARAPRLWTLESRVRTRRFRPKPPGFWQRLRLEEQWTRGEHHGQAAG